MNKKDQKPTIDTIDCRANQKWYRNFAIVFAGLSIVSAGEAVTLGYFAATGRGDPKKMIATAMGSAFATGIGVATVGHCILMKNENKQAEYDAQIAQQNN